MKESSCAYEIIHETFHATGNSLSVSSLCSMVDVSRRGYYAWLKMAPVREAQEQMDRKDFDLILEAYHMRGYSKGAKASIWPFSIGIPQSSGNAKKSGGSWTSITCHALCARQTPTAGWPEP